MIIGADNGETLLSGERCDVESDFMTWLFSQDHLLTHQLQCIPPLDSARGGFEDGSMMNPAVASDFDHDGHVDIISSFDGQVSLLRGPSWKPYTLHVFDEKDSRTTTRELYSQLLDGCG